MGAFMCVIGIGIAVSFILYSMVKNWEQEDIQNKPAVKYLKTILGKETVEEHDQNWIKQQKIEEAPDNFIDETEQLLLF